MELWSQVYDPLGNTILSTLVCAIPVLVLLGGLGHLQDPRALRRDCGTGRGGGYRPVPARHARRQWRAARRCSVALFALTTICWIIVNLIFLYRMTVKSGLFKVLQDSIGGITNDRRLQLILIAFCFGAFFEGAAGGGTPVAVTGAILIGLGFSPLAASGLVADRQYRAGRLRRHGNADHRLEQRYAEYRRLSAHVVGDGWAAAAVLFGARAVLDRDRILRLAPDDAGLAGGPGGGSELCDSAVSDLELSRARGWWTWCRRWSRSSRWRLFLRF